MGFKVGEKSRGVCDHCNQMVSTTFEKRIVEGIPVKHAEEKQLVSVCDLCNNIVGVVIPSSSKRKKK